MIVEHLLYPEWQGYGVDASVHDGSLAVARAVFPDAAFAHVESPRDETLIVGSGVLGLSSIAARFRTALARLRESAPDVVVTVGGTCGVEAAPVAYLNERYAGDLAVVWFDAHGDLNTPSSSPSGHFHGMVLRTLLGDGPPEYVAELRRTLQPQQIFLAGTRDLDPGELAFVRDAGISVTPPAAFTDPLAVAAAVRARGFRNVYLHLDMDCFDPDEFPDALVLTPGGPSFASVKAMLLELDAAFGVAGCSFVEYVDRGGRSLGLLRDLPIPGARGMNDPPPH
jgi:arginase